MPITFHEGVPHDLKPGFDPGIFHDPKHLGLQASTGWHSFFVKQDDSLAALVHFHLTNREAASPYRSPFGSFLFSDTLPEAALIDFIAYCESRLMDNGIKSVNLKNQPHTYHPGKNQMLLVILGKLGYSVAREETSAILSVTDKSFESGLHKSEKKRLRKCRAGSLDFARMPLEQLQKIYVFLEACREEKGYSLSMPFDEIRKLADAFPERIVLTAVLDKSKIVAANISIRVYEAVLYNFYHDHAGEYDHLSPVVLLNEGLYRFCQADAVRLLDLGTSNINGQVNESLLAFKLHLGAQPSRKLTFVKNLA